jgi:hypothetical protein
MLEDDQSKQGRNYHTENVVWQELSKQERFDKGDCRFQFGFTKWINA